MNDKLLNKIISVAYGDAGFGDKIRIRLLANKNDEVKKLLECYRKTAEEVHKLKEEECPEELLNGIEGQTINVVKHSDTFVFDFFSIIFTSPLVSTAAAFVVIAMIMLGIFLNRSIQHQYTTAEIELADKQAKHALAIVGRIFNQTNHTLKEEVLNSRVAKPIRESMGIVNNLFTSKNELNAHPSPSQKEGRLNNH